MCLIVCILRLQKGQRLTIRDDAQGPPDVADIFLRVVNPQLAVDSGHEILHLNRSVGRSEAILVGCAYGAAALNASSCDGYGEATGEVVSASVHIDLWSPSELARHQDQRSIEHSAFGKV